MSIVAELPTRAIFRALFGISTATPLQLAICRLLDGEPVTKPEQVEALTQASGGVLPTERPLELYLLAAIRSGKSLIASAHAVRASQTVDVSGLRHGEIPRYSIVSTSVKNSRAIFRHLVGTIRANGILRELLVGEPTADTLMLRHPTGRPVEVSISAGHRAGSSLVSDWSAGVAFDEAPRMIGEDDGVVNLDHSVAAVALRLLPGAQLLFVGSPWAPFGPVYRAVQEHYGKPSAARVVLRAAGPAMNPKLFTVEEMARMQRDHPDAYATDVLAEFRQPESGLFGSELDACVRVSRETLPPQSTHYYVAAIDPAARGNAWTLVVMTRERERRVVVLTREWKGSKAQPINPSQIMEEIAAILRPYHVTELVSDQWSYDALRDIAERSGLYLRQRPLTQSEAADAWTSLRSAMVQGLLELAGEQLVSDLRRLVKRTTQAAFVIHLPETSDGRHCDYAPALLRAWLSYCQPADIPRSPAEMEAERIDGLRRRQEAPPPLPKRLDGSRRLGGDSRH